MSGPGPSITVAHVIHSLGAGGAEKVLTDLAQVRAGAGFEMVVVSLSPTADPVHAQRLRSLGIRVIELERARWDPRAVGEVLDVLRREKVDVVHTHLKHADVVGGLAAWRGGLPQIATLHLIEEPTDALGRFKAGLAARVRNARAARIIAVSRAQRDWYLSTTRLAPERVVVVPNGVLEAPVPAAEQRDCLRAEVSAGRSAGVVALMAAIMRPGKGHDTLLDALRLLPAELGLTVALAGDGALLPAIRSEVEADEALRARVVLLGYRTDIPHLLQAVDFVVHPTEADALPTILIEAAASGRPAVATAVGGVPDIVTADTGILVPPRDSAALAAALAQMAGDGSRRAALGGRARRAYEARFTADRWVERLGGLYREAVTESAPR